jgi:hypothetical protein
MPIKPSLTDADRDEHLGALLVGESSDPDLRQWLETQPASEALAALVRRLRRQEGYFRDLSRLIENVNAGKTLPEIFSFVYDEFRTFIPYDRLGVALLSENAPGEAGHTLKLVWSRSALPNMKLEAGFSGTLAGSSLEEILVSGRPRIINDLVEYQRQKPSSPATTLIVAEGVRSSLTCPLIAQGRGIGFLFFSSAQVGTYRSAHIGTFQLLAGNLAVAVEKAGAYERLMELNSWKDRFLGMAAHDLRSPIALIVSYLELFQTETAGQEPGEADRIMKKIREICNRMLLLVNDLLDISAIENGGLELKMRRVPMGDFLRSVVADAAMMAQIREVAVTGELGGMLPELNIDEQRIRQVLDNLIGNAVKFSRAGTTVTVAAIPEPTGLRVEIRDQGPGIPENEMNRLFQFFGKTSVRAVRGEKSTGLGLAIVRKIVENHGGVVGVHSQVGQGSVFHFTLPLPGFHY